MGCVSREYRSEAGQRKEVTVPRRSPPRIVPGMSDVECLSVGRRKESIWWARAGGGFSLFAKLQQGAGE